MRTAHLAIALPAIVLLASCQKTETEDLISAELDLRYDDLDFTVDPGQQGMIDLSLAFDARSSMAELLQQNGYTMDDLKDVRISEARVVIIEPVNAHFDAVENLGLDFTSPAGAPINIARMHQVPDGLGILELTLDHADLTPFFRTTTGSLHAHIETSTPINEETKFRFVLNFQVKAGS